MGALDLLPPGLSGIVVGVALGLTGGGGSIFALPLLVHVLHVSVRDAVVVSLATVGATALFGAALKARSVQWGAALFFSLAGIAGAPLGTWIGLQIPARATLIGFALLMATAGFRMWRRPREASKTGTSPRILLIFGFVTGVLAGVFGVGGGFLVVPALVLGAGLMMREAIATSLFAIALISASALVSQGLCGGFAIDTGLLVTFTGGALVGMAGGTAVRNWLSEIALRRTFAVGMWGVAAALLLK